MIKYINRSILFSINRKKGNSRASQFPTGEKIEKIERKPISVKAVISELYWTFERFAINYRGKHASAIVIYWADNEWVESARLVLPKKMKAIHFSLIKRRLCPLFYIHYVIVIYVRPPNHRIFFWHPAKLELLLW